MIFGRPDNKSMQSILLQPMIPILLLLSSTLALVISDFLAFRPGRYLFKPLAAATFIYLALVMGATQTTYGNWLLAGLALCFIGDVFLMAESDRFFLAGLAQTPFNPRHEDRRDCLYTRNCRYALKRKYDLRVCTRRFDCRRSC